MLAGCSPELKYAHNMRISAKSVQKGFGNKGNGPSMCNLTTILNKNPRFEEISPDERNREHR